MARKSIDCRNVQDGTGCDLKLSGSEEHLLTAAVEHSVSVHGREDTPEFREQLKGMFEDEEED